MKTAWGRSAQINGNINVMRRFFTDERETLHTNINHENHKIPLRIYGLSSFTFLCKQELLLSDEYLKYYREIFV